MKSLRLISSTLSIMIVLSFYSVDLFAQGGSVNLTGNWILNESKSNLGEGRMRFASSPLVIRQEGNNLSVERTNNNPRGNATTTSEKYTLDGRPNKNTGGMRTPVESTVTWTDNGTTLTFRSTRSFERQGQAVEMKTTEVWSLTSGGNILTINQTSSTPQGNTQRVLVYDKK